MSLAMLKSIATTVLLVLALVQALGMAQVRGYVSLLPVEKRRLRRIHSRGGIAALVLSVAVALACVFGVGYAPCSLRVWLHVIMGVLAILILFLKMALTRRFRRYLRFNTALGVAVGLLLLGTFVTSALWYFLFE